MNEFQKFRKSHNLTIKEVSIIHEIPYRTLQNWEYGVTTPPKYIITMMNDLWEGKHYIDKYAIIEMRKKELKKC